ncbi:hypothetical protein ACUOFC_56460, partial [Escherichia sp. TWPC-MK]
PSANNFIFIHSIPDSKEAESSFSSEFLNTLSDIRGGIPYQNEFYNDDSNGHLDDICVTLSTNKVLNRSSDGCNQAKLI